MIAGDLRVRPFKEEDARRWDELIASSWNGTFLHTRRFLSYHEQRFQDASLVVENDKGEIIGALPAAVDPSEEARIVSHPGITYGGIVHGGALRGSKLLGVLENAVKLYSADGRSSFRYKPIPYIYHRIPSSDDLYALFRHAAVRYRCDLSATIDLANRPTLEKRRRRCLKRAEQSGVRVERGAPYLPAFWKVLEANLASKYAVRPVHSLEELTQLSALFPQNIEHVFGMLEDEVVAGVVLFHCPPVVHAQYIAASEAGRSVSALDVVFDDCITRAKDNGSRYFDFGNSNERDGTYLNDGLHQFKTEFGAGGVVHEFYELRLN